MRRAGGGIPAWKQGKWTKGPGGTGIRTPESFENSQHPLFARGVLTETRLLDFNSAVIQCS